MLVMELQSNTGSKPTLLACSEGVFRCWKGRDLGYFRFENAQFSKFFPALPQTLLGAYSSPKTPPGFVFCPSVTSILDPPVGFASLPSAWHCIPFPEYPSTHWHVYDSIVLLHTAWGLQWWDPARHSSTSEKDLKKCAEDQDESSTIKW